MVSEKSRVFCVTTCFVCSKTEEYLDSKIYPVVNIFRFFTYFDESYHYLWHCIYVSLLYQLSLTPWPDNNSREPVYRPFSTYCSPSVGTFLDPSFVSPSSIVYVSGTLPVFKSYKLLTFLEFTLMLLSYSQESESMKLHMITEKNLTEVHTHVPSGDET